MVITFQNHPGILNRRCLDRGGGWSVIEWGRGLHVGAEGGRRCKERLLRTDTPRSCLRATYLYRSRTDEPRTMCDLESVNVAAQTYQQPPPVLPFEHYTGHIRLNRITPGQRVCHTARPQINTAHTPLYLGQGVSCALHRELYHRGT